MSKQLLTGDEAYFLAKRYTDTHGGGGSGVLVNDITSNITVGGVPSGTTYNSGTTLEKVITDMLVTYLAPSVTFSISPSQSLVLYGTTIDKVTMSATITKKSNPISKVEFKVNGTVVETITDNVESGGSFSFVYSTSTEDTTTFSVVAYDGKNNGTGSQTITFCNATYYGVVSDLVVTPTATDIKALNFKAVNDKAYTYSNINTEYGKILYAYPKSYGDLTNIKDLNNLEYINSYTKSIVDVDGVEYNTYLLTSAVGVSDFTQIYK